MRCLERAASGRHWLQSRCSTNPDLAAVAVGCLPREVVSAASRVARAVPVSTSAEMRARSSQKAAGVKAAWCLQ